MTPGVCTPQPPAGSGNDCMNGGSQGWVLHRGDAADAYKHWPPPTLIVSDGAYGVGGFPGDPRTADELPAWYGLHIEAWAACSTPATTLWFWCTELGWATVHPVLARHGWEYVQAIVWDKGLAHIAGNVNGDTIRRFPTVTEICVFYRWRLEFSTPQGVMTAKQWLRYEWQRTGLPLRAANEACGVADAATRKYLTQDWLWYFPPAEMMARLVGYANTHGDPAGRPYYSVDGNTPVTGEQWAAMRHVWNHHHGLTNVWAEPPLSGPERYKGRCVRGAPRTHRSTCHTATHLNQKPIELMRRIIEAASKPGDVVWEPFGGLCTATVAAVEAGRRGYAAETDDWFADLAADRLSATDQPTGSCTRPVRAGPRSCAATTASQRPA